MENASAGTASVDNASAESAENPLVTKHTAEIDGKKISYTATAGTMPMNTRLGQYEIFYTAYTMDGVKDLNKRPITFVFNGGPGASSCWLQIGLYGPAVIDIPDDGIADRLSIGTKNNECSILDLTDMVFIDPVGTGYSRALPGTDPKVFYDYYNDIYSIGDFIRQYIGRSNRWLSPKYISGESYGTERAVGLCSYMMSDLRMNVDGLILISCLNDYLGDLTSGGNDVPYVNYFPTMATAAWYHKKADQKYLSMTIEQFMDEARDFASGDYLAALYKGDRITPLDRSKMAMRMSTYLGVSREFIMKKNLRVDYVSFCDELLKDRNLRIGRVDARLTGPVTSGSMEDAEGDPAASGMIEAFTTAFGDYCCW